MAEKDWSEILGEFGGKDRHLTRKINPFNEEVGLSRQIFLYGHWNPKEAVKEVNLGEVNDGIVARIDALGISTDRIPVREGTPEEIKDAGGRYLKGEILINPMYTDQTGEAILSADFYDQAFTRNHLQSQDVEDLRTDHVARMRHLAEDLVAHEYGHHVFKNVYRDELQSEAAKSESDTEGFYIVPTHSFEEGFARWFNAAVVGHTHTGDKADLVLFGEDDEFYSNKAGILQAYDALTQAAEQNGAQYVLENMVEIAVPVIVDLKKKQDQRMREKHGDLFADFGKYITIE